MLTDVTVAQFPVTNAVVVGTAVVGTVVTTGVVVAAAVVLIAGVVTGFGVPGVTGWTPWFVQ